MTEKKRVRRATRAYTGVLAQPLKISLPIGHGILGITDEQRIEHSKAILDAQMAKIPALFAHYGLDPKKPKHALYLILLLAEDHVPGFRIAERRGAPRKNGLDWDLYARVRLLEIKNGLSTVAACNALAKQLAKGKPNGSTLSAATLRRRYMAVARAASAIFNKAAAHDNISEAEMLKGYLSGTV